MGERHDIELRQEGSDNPPDVLLEIRELFQELVPAATQGAANWVRGKGEAEVARAAEIKAKVLERVSRVINEQRQLAQSAKREQEDAASKHQEEMYRLQTDRIAAKVAAWKEVVSSLETLKELGVEIEARLVVSGLESLIETIQTETQLEVGTSPLGQPLD